ncbi:MULTISPECIES: D-ribose pyranase [unclassified Comamonas]|uniref:D-ribose pyranase n=1 Tax=unclassified Comamonas TaxID=2638500 RepID=UPI00106046CB|nr:D-ribose pyranase [Comamonas sp. JUb58]TDS76255.1 D-ribose pyranase [Comamonas sp. JUb58]
MKRAALLNIELSQIIAAMGHGDMLVIGDAGLPVPPGVRRVDLAVARGVPSLDQVLQAILSELQVEAAIVANECLDGQQLPAWYQQRQADGLPSAPQCVSHEEFKAMSRQAVAVVRTGECTPYANIALRSGVAF